MKTLAVLTLLLSSIASANICDDVHALANRWHRLANAIHERTHENLSPADRKRVAKEDRLLIPPSRELVTICSKESDKRVQSLGKQLAALLDEYASLNDNESWDEDVKVIDKMVHVMDDLTGICDSK
jgi:hypothetical protein